jgi:hypothetical protein
MSIVVFPADDGTYDVTASCAALRTIERIYCEPKDTIWLEKFSVESGAAGDIGIGFG